MHALETTVEFRLLINAAHIKCNKTKNRPFALKMDTPLQTTSMLIVLEKPKFITRK